MPLLARVAFDSFSFSATRIMAEIVVYMSFEPHPGCLILFEGSQVRNQELSRIFALAIGVLTLVVWQSQRSTGASANAASANDAFRKLQSLTGDWEGKDEQGKQVKSSFVSIAAETAVMETLSLPEMHDMVTLYSMDGNSIVLTHYCPTNNQPRMRSMPAAPPIRELVFSFQGAGNLPDIAVGHEHKLVILFEDTDHITERWTWRRAGKDTDMIFHLVRTHSERK
jgi:hypothetical protein